MTIKEVVKEYIIIAHFKIVDFTKKIHLFFRLIFKTKTYK